MSSISESTPATEPPAADQTAASYRYRFANAEYDASRNLLRLDGREVTVEPLPLQLLTLLLSRPDEVVRHAELLQTLWKGRHTGENVLANVVSKLRAALGKQAASRLVNAARVGYRLKGPVERLAAGRKPLPAPSLAAGMPVPGREDFVLLRLLGASAASAVWLARHQRLQEMQVFKFAGDRDQLAALKRELTSCRLLTRELGRRADLVAVKDSNFSRAPFFLAYEHGGVDLRTWAAEQPHLAAMPPEERVVLFLQIAHAVAAAHGVGILHRDLKPGNVLIDAAPAGAGAHWQVRLTDFGSSHLLVPDRLRELGITPMGMTITGGDHPWAGATPHYIAPELLAGENPTMRSDLYALGLMLYQLLVGDLARPLATGWENDIAEPLLVDDVRAATEGRPERRLASVAQLIERLESLHRRGVQRDAAADAARRMQLAAERLEKIRSRRPWLMALAVCIALGGLGAAWFGVQARAAQREAERATARARAINDFLNVDVLRSADATLAGGMVPKVALIDVLARASDRVGERFKDDAPVLAQVRRQLGDIYLGMSFADQAEEQYQRAVTVLEPLVPADDAELLAVRFGLAQSLTGRDRPAQALAGLDIAERAAGAASLAGDGPVARRALRARVQVMMDDGRHDREALLFARRLVELSDLPPDGGEADLRGRLQAREWLAELYARLGDDAHAAALIETLQSPPFNSRRSGAAVFARVQLRLARQHLQHGRWADAESALIALRDTPAQALRPNELHLGLLSSALFDVYYGSGRFQQALQASEVVLQAYRAALGDRHRLVTTARIDTALSELELGRTAEALRDLEAARLRLDANGHHVDQLLALDLGRARALNSLGRHDEALQLLQERNPSHGAASEAPAPGLLAEWQAETARSLLASGPAAPGRAAVTLALQAMRQAGLPPWKLARYQTLLAQR